MNIPGFKTMCGEDRITIIKSMLFSLCLQAYNTLIYLKQG